MPFRTGAVAGGVPLFNAQNPLQPTIFTTPDYLATAEGENVVRQERVVYSPSSTPVFVAPTATPLALAEVAGAIVRRTLVRSLAVFAATSALAEPVYVPVVAATSIDSTLASVHSSPVIVKSRVVYDQTAARPVFPPVAVAVLPPPDAPQSGFARSRIKRTPLSAFVFAYPIDDLAADYTDPVVRAIRPKPKLLPDGAIHPPFLPPAAPTPPALDPLASAYSAPTVVLSRVVYDPTATPVFKPVVATVTPAAFAYQPADAARRVQRKVLPDGIATPLFQPGAITPAAFGHQTELTWKRQRKVLPDGIADSFTPPAAVTPAPFAQAIEAVWRVLKKALPEGFTAPIFPPAFVPPPTIDSTFASALSPATVVLSRVVYDTTAAPVFKPVPTAATPANLFDNIGAVQRTLPNGKAIGINLQGFAWSPQDPANLTGSVQGPDTGPGGACRPEPKGPRLPYYRELREKDFWPKSRRLKKYEELLEELQAKADVPAVVVEAVSVLAGKTEAPQIETSADLAALARLVQAYRVNQRATEQAIAQAQANRVAEAAAAADAEMIAVVLALEEEEMKQILAIAMLLATED